MEVVSKEIIKQHQQKAIPNEWVITRLGDITDVQRGASPRPISSPKWFSKEKDVGWVRISDISDSNGKYLFKTKDYLSKEGIIRSRFLPKNSLILSIAATVGVPVITKIKTCIHDGFVGLTNLKVEQEFLYYILKFIENDLVKEGQTGSQNNINSQIVRDFKVKIPKETKEQRVIAATLGNIDELIASLDALIEKKKKIKKGAMQQLLTGKKRLPGFSGKWEEKKFTEVTDLITCGLAKTPKYVNPSRGYPFLSSTNVKNGEIQWENYKYISEDHHRNLYKNNPPQKGDLLYSRVGTIGEAAVIKTEKEFSIYVSLTLIKPKKGVLDSYYLKHLLNSNKYKQRANEQVYLGGGVGNLNVGVVREYPIPLPQIKEQKAIAKVGKALEDELQSLRQKKAKYKKIKQGMMQELLTGKTRLV